MNRWIVTLTLCLAVALTACESKKKAGAGGAAATTTNEAGFKSVTDKEITLQWKVNGENLDCILSAKTTGWIAVGFNNTHKMDGSNFIIGYIGEKTEIFDHYGKGHGHKPDTVSNIVASTGKEENEITELQFTIPLIDDENQQDLLLEPGKKYHVLLAIGKADKFGYHKARTSVEIEL